MDAADAGGAASLRRARTEWDRSGRRLCPTTTIAAAVARPRSRLSVHPGTAAQRKLALGPQDAETDCAEQAARAPSRRLSDHLARSIRRRRSATARPGG